MEHMHKFLHSTFLHIIRFLTISIILLSCEEKDYVFENFTPLDDYSSYIQTPEDDSIFQRALTACPNSINYGKSVGVFGGSLSRAIESQVAKSFWRNYLKMEIVDYGIGGNGFATLSANIQQQVNKAKIHDIYILWASTNDLQENISIGEKTDYTILDNFDSSKLSTQCGGINYCIKHLREVNPKSTIYLFTSLKHYSTPFGYERTIKNKYTLFDYVQKQIECADMQNIEYFDQWMAQDGRITKKNWKTYYQYDGFHLKALGYLDIGIRQLLFLAQEEE